MSNSSAVLGKFGLVGLCNAFGDKGSYREKHMHNKKFVSMCTSKRMALSSGNSLGSEADASKSGILLVISS